MRLTETPSGGFATLDVEKQSVMIIIIMITNLTMPRLDSSPVRCPQDETSLGIQIQPLTKNHVLISWLSLLRIKCQYEGFQLQFQHVNGYIYYAPFLFASMVILKRIIMNKKPKEIERKTHLDSRSRFQFTDTQWLRAWGDGHPLR